MFINMFHKFEQCIVYWLNPGLGAKWIFVVQNLVTALYKYKTSKMCKTCCDSKKIRLRSKHDGNSGFTTTVVQGEVLLEIPHQAPAQGM